MAEKKDHPYIWTTWLTRLLSGDSSCEWAAQFRAHHESKSYSKVSSGFDAARWQMEHTALLNKARAEMESTGANVYIEGQNFFTLRGRTATLSGKPDLVSIEGNTGVIADAKTGQQSISHQIQVLIYMYALPKALPQYRDVTFEGKLVYPDEEVFIPSDGVNEGFVTELGGLITRLADSGPAIKTPSKQECSFCNITMADCKERIDDDLEEDVQRTADF